MCVYACAHAYSCALVFVGVAVPSNSMLLLQHLPLLVLMPSLEPPRTAAMTVYACLHCHLSASMQCQKEMRYVPHPDILHMCSHWHSVSAVQGLPLYALPNVCLCAGP